LCDRLAVLRSGQVAATGTVQELIAAQNAASIVRFTPPDGSAVHGLRSVPGVEGVVAEADGSVAVTGHGPVLARIAHALVERGIEPADLRVELPSLEDTYLAIANGADEGDGAAAGVQP
jgi:ABC-2 type transport system ATP-binding protein